MSDGLRLFILNRVHQRCHVVLHEGRLQARHRVQSHAEAPDVGPLVVALVLNDLWGERQGCANYFVRLDVVSVVENARLRHVPKFYDVLTCEHDIQTLDVSVDHALRVNMKNAHTNLPGEGPDVFLREVDAPLQLSLDQLLNVAPIRELHHDVEALTWPTETLQLNPLQLVAGGADPQRNLRPRLRDFFAVLIYAISGIVNHTVR